MIVFVAQGGGFYGCALMTRDLTLQEAREKLASIGWEATPSEQDGSFSVEPEETPFTQTSQTIVTVREWHGQPQPKPVVVMDTGHAGEDLAALIHLQKVLEL